MVQPNPVHHHSRSQWVARTCNRLCQLLPPTPVLECRAIRSTQDLQEPARHNVPLLVRLTTDEQRRILRLRRILHDHRPTRRPWMREIDPVLLSQKAADFSLHFPGQSLCNRINRPAMAQSPTRKIHQLTHRTAPILARNRMPILPRRLA